MSLILSLKNGNSGRVRSSLRNGTNRILEAYWAAAEVNVTTGRMGVLAREDASIMHRKIVLITTSAAPRTF